MDRMRVYKHPDVVFVDLNENNVILTSFLGDNDRDDFETWRNQ